ncbi:MAG: RNase HII [uncultured archaeon A07HR60]|nr:MAG: RNase HII [uncultured archaeon A07HR60]
MDIRVGVDEAGKGPVFGPMVVAAVRAPVEAIPEGVADSKALAAGRRAELADRLRADDRVSAGLALITPTEIDAPDTDMNGLTVAGHVRALSQVVAEGDPAVSDAGDVDADRFCDRVDKGLTQRGQTVSLVAEHGADAEYPIVGAASILAKVRRDGEIASLATDHGEIGSGYPSDPTTREFLRQYVARHGDVPPFARRSWSTCDDVLAAAEQSELAEF